MSHQHTDLFEFFKNSMLNRQQPLLIELDELHRVLRYEGSFDHYGYKQPDNGETVVEVLPFLAGLLDTLDEEPLLLPYMAAPNGCSTDVHLQKAGSNIGVLIVDVSEKHDRLQDQQQMANELQLLRKKQEKLLAQLKEANSAKSTFIANMSHEFRTPLTSVIGYGDLLHDIDGLPEQANGYLSAIERNARHLLVMIDNLLDQAKVDAEALRVSPVRAQLLPVFEDIELLLQPLADKKLLTLKVITQGTMPTDVMVDQMRLRQLLINVAGNAIKYTQQGSITVSAQHQSDRLTVVITDTGPGIPVDYQRKVFTPFEQNLERGGQKGAGLGLAISREIAQAMGGDLELTYSDERGSQFTFWIEAKEVKPAESPALPVSFNILIAEDDPDIQALLTLYLQSAGYTITLCGDGESAVEHALRVSPDIVLMDINLPKLDGAEATRRLRQSQFFRPIVAMTAAASESARNEAINAGFDDFLQKPIDPKQLKESVAALLTSD